MQQDQSSLGGGSFRLDNQVGNILNKTRTALETIEFNDWLPQSPPLSLSFPQLILIATLHTCRTARTAACTCHWQLAHFSLPSLSTSHYPSVKGQCCYFLLLLLLVARLLCPLCCKCYQFYTPLIIFPAPSPFLLLTWRLLLLFDVFLSLSSCLCSLICVCFELYTNFWLSIWTVLPRGTARPSPHSPSVLVAVAVLLPLLLSLLLSLSVVCPLFVYRFNRPWIITRWLPWPQQVPLSFAHSTRSTPIATPPSPLASWLCCDFACIYYCQFFRRDIDLLPIQTKTKRNSKNTAKLMLLFWSPSLCLLLRPLLFLHLSTPGQVVNQFEFRMLVLLKSSHLFYSLQMRILQPSLRVLKVYPGLYLSLCVCVYACLFRIFRYACDIFSLILFSSRQHLKCFLWIWWRFMSGVSCA